MKYSSRFFLYAPFTGLLVLAGVASVNWWTKASALATRLDAVNGHELMPGVRIHFGAKTLAGFPFRLDTVLKNLRVEAADVTGPVVWTTAGFAMHVLAYGRNQAILEAGGQQTLSWRDRSGVDHRFVFLPGTFRASTILAKGALQRFDAEIVDLDADSFRAAKVQFHLRRRDGSIDVYLTLDGAHASSGYAASLGPDISQLIADTTLNHAGTLDALMRGEQSSVSALDAWRQAGGRLMVNKLLVARGKQTESFSGELTLDDAHDLTGIVTAPNHGIIRFDGNRMVRGSGLP